jgi:hypothetical protein
MDFSGIAMNTMAMFIQKSSLVDFGVAFLSAFPYSARGALPPMPGVAVAHGVRPAALAQGQH